MLIGPAELYPSAGGSPSYQLIDVRSPIEVARGRLPRAHELPLMTDGERHAVGIRYKEAGREAAIALGFALTEGLMDARVAAWRSVSRTGRTAVTCWRGGLRSELAVRFIDDPSVVRVEGGYKAIRRYLMQRLEPELARRRLLVLGGLTGSGKTRLLRSLRSDALQVVDLEGEARHRGSSFGATDAPQPSQPTFENALAVQVVLGKPSRLVVEDESRFVGRRTLPTPLLAAMARAPLVLLETPLHERVGNVFEEYVRRPAERHGVQRTLAELERNTVRLRKRIGGGRCKRLVAAIHAAEPDWFDPAAHETWIGELLESHYDRLYRKAMDALGRDLAFRGDATAVSAFLTSP